jgi:dihydrofolate synthase/folylpolyglutamate synthase
MTQSKPGPGGPQSSKDNAGELPSATLLRRMQELHPKSIDLSLGRIERLLLALGSPDQQFPQVVHVAGTNGKGSVIAFLKAMLEAAGMRVNTLTSPHLVRFHERIGLAGDSGNAPISEEYLVDVLGRAMAAKGKEPITFFEITTAAAFLAFAETPADFVILETGLGGRLDATNVFDQPRLTIITPISIDHTRFLGDKITAIADEKAGIIKPGVTCVVAPQRHEALDRIEQRASDLGSPLLVAGHDWDAYEQHGRLVYQTPDELLDLPLPKLIGRHQIDNAATAITAAQEILPRLGIEAALASGLSKAHWPARLDRLPPGQLHRHLHPQTEIWLDGGHNPAAAEVLARTMAELEERVPRPLHLICGMMADKDADAFFHAFQGLVQWAGTISIPGEPNCFDGTALADAAKANGIEAQAASDLTEALGLSQATALEPVRILICGSLYLAGHALELHATQSEGEEATRTTG